MLAIIRTGGKQYSVSPGDIIRVEKLPAQRGDSVELDDVLLVQDGAETRCGTPTVQGAVVKARVLTHGRGKKIRVRKYKQRKGYRRSAGHRQDYTQLLIESIEAA